MAARRAATASKRTAHDVASTAHHQRCREHTRDTRMRRTGTTHDACAGNVRPRGGGSTESGEYEGGDGPHRGSEGHAALVVAQEGEELPQEGRTAPHEHRVLHPPDPRVPAPAQPLCSPRTYHRIPHTTVVSARPVNGAKEASCEVGGGGR